ncbi:MAG: phosphonate C-P lyase system protein PhnH [Spirochaetaceae bacterium]|jgi:phosphonate C-P lyase system protein PhnH|nr:phosphonate C-P lyase system protein PhnH [Spirochaetaceae bacterium]
MKSKHDFDRVHGAQGLFRLFLEALANPGRDLPMGAYTRQFAAHGRWLAPALTLLDNETRFFWDGEAALGEEIRFLSGASCAPLPEADFVFLSAPADPAGVLSQVKAGTHRDPHDSALIFVAAPGDLSLSVSLSGPGIPPEGRELELSPGEAAWVRARDDQGFEYPCGVELVCLRGDSLVALTRKAAAVWPT